MKITAFLLTVLLSTSLWAHDNNIHLKNTKLNIMGEIGNIHGIISGGNTDKVIKSLSIDGVKKTEVHTMSMIDGVMKMSKIKNLMIKADEKITLEKGGKHIMLMGIKKPLHNPTLTIIFTDNTKSTFIIKN